METRSALARDKECTQIQFFTDNESKMCIKSYLGCSEGGNGNCVIVFEVTSSAFSTGPYFEAEPLRVSEKYCSVFQERTEGIINGKIRQTIAWFGTGNCRQ